MNLQEARKGMLEKLKASLLSAADAKRLGLTPYGEGHELDINPKWAGFQIPYWKLDGTRLDFFRFRFLQYKPSTGFGALVDDPEKPRRYAQPKGSGCVAYFSPLAPMPWKAIAKDPSVALVMTEGENKASCACKLGIPTVGLGGVFNWKSAASRVDLLPELEAFDWNGRQVNIAFDSDITANAMVRLAASSLAAALARRGAVTCWTTFPPAADGSKQGLDDYALAEGPEALVEVLARAEALGAGVDLHRMNGEAAVIRATGEIVEAATGNVYSASLFADVVYKPRTYTVFDGPDAKAAVKRTAKEWLGWPLRTEVERLEYAPEHESQFTPDGAYNTWWAQRWPLAPSGKGSVAPWEDMFDHVFGGLPKDLQAWVKAWFAWPLVHPGAKLSTALLVWGRQQGTGKTLMGETMRRIYGKNYGTVNNAQLSGQFNEWAENKQFIVGDEISIGDKRGIANSLKDMITRTTLRMNIKNRKTYAVRDCINYFFTSNHEDAIYMEADDRRIFVCHADTNPRPQAEYSAYQKWLDTGGAERLFYHLLHEVPLEKFDPMGRAPGTTAKAEMAASGRGDTEDWCIQLKADPDSLLSERHPFDLFRTQDLLLLYDPDQKGRTKVIGLGKALGAAGIFRVAGGSNNAVIGGARTRLWAVRNAGRYARMGAAEAAVAYEAERSGGKAGRKFEAGKRVVQ